MFIGSRPTTWYDVLDANASTQVGTFHLRVESNDAYEYCNVTSSKQCHKPPVKYVWVRACGIGAAGVPFCRTGYIYEPYLRFSSTQASIRAVRSVLGIDLFSNVLRWEAGRLGGIIGALIPNLLIHVAQLVIALISNLWAAYKLPRYYAQPRGDHDE